MADLAALADAEQAQIERLTQVCNQFPLANNPQALNDLADKAFHEWLAQARERPDFYQRPLVICIPEIHCQYMDVEATLWALKTLKSVRDSDEKLKDAPLVFHVEDDRDGLKLRFEAISNLK